MSAPVLQPEIQDPGLGSGRWVVVIFNNDHTPRDLVVLALIRATACDHLEAEMETWEAEHYGRALVHFAPKEECVQAAEIIQSIGVKTEVSREWND